MRPSTTCLYSAASMLRAGFGAAQRVASNPNGAERSNSLDLAVTIASAPAACNGSVDRRLMAAT